MTPEEIAKDEAESQRVQELNQQVRERFVKDHRCYGCDGHAMEQRNGGWYCYTCGSMAFGCGR